MSDRRANKKGRSTREPRFVRLYHWFMETPAWQSLNGNERAVYLDIAKRYAGPGSNNGRIPYAVRDAAKTLPIGLATAHRCLKRLEEVGFIICTQKGTFKASHDASTWRLTEFPDDTTGELATKDFARWQNPKKQNAVSVVELHRSCAGTVPYLRRNGAPLKTASR